MSAKWYPFLAPSLLVVSLVWATTFLQSNDRLAGLKPFTLRLPCGSLMRGGLAMVRVKKSRSPITGTQEYICQCPRCLTVETLWFGNDILVPTIKFSQGEDGRVYHDCNRGSAGPCRLFPIVSC